MELLDLWSGPLAVLLGASTLETFLCTCKLTVGHAADQRAGSPLTLRSLFDEGIYPGGVFQGSTPTIKYQLTISNST